MVIIVIMIVTFYIFTNDKEPPERLAPLGNMGAPFETARIWRQYGTEGFNSGATLCAESRNHLTRSMRKIAVGVVRTMRAGVYNYFGAIMALSLIVGLLELSGMLL